MTLLLRAATAPKYKAAFATAHGAGLRASEVIALKVGDIDSTRIRHQSAVRGGGVGPCVTERAETGSGMRTGNDRMPWMKLE